MEKLIIDIPKDKSVLVKQLLKALGVDVKPYPKVKGDKNFLTQISVWEDDDIQSIEEVSKSMDKFDIGNGNRIKGLKMI